MVTIEYKILFEVRLLHDYYLTDMSGNSFFSLDVNTQSAFLEEKLKKEKYNIQDDIDLLISHKDQAFFRNHRMKVVKTQLGFFIGIEVISEKSGGGKVIYKPYISVKEDAELLVGLGLKNQQFQNLTNLPLASDEGNLLFFTNTDEKKKNILSRPIATLKEGQEYNMGDLSRRGNFTYKAIEKNIGETQFWQRISGNGYVHQADISPIRHETWFQDWFLGLGNGYRFPFAILKLRLKSEHPELSPLKENGYLSTEFLPSHTRPNHPVFELRFLGRSTYWRYKKVGGFSTKERDYINEHAGDLLNFENGDFVTKSPHFLAAEMPYLASNGFRLPTAKPYLIRYENEKVFSDINFNPINTIHGEA